jgi:hypothetical protein
MVGCTYCIIFLYTAKVWQKMIQPARNLSTAKIELVKQRLPFKLEPQFDLSMVNAAFMAKGRVQSTANVGYTHNGHDAITSV